MAVMNYFWILTDVYASTNVNERNSLDSFIVCRHGTADVLRYRIVVFLSCYSI